MKQLKDMVGQEVIAYARAQNMKPRPRRINDAAGRWNMLTRPIFHLDILPSIPDVDEYKSILENYQRNDLLDRSDITDLAIAITDKELPQYAHMSDDWPVSNPQGFGTWFNHQQAIILQEHRQKLVDNMIYDSVKEVPAYRTKTPLQRAIQLLKRHRDSMFEGDEDKPISIIITTLAAHAYNGEREIRDALRTILRGMKDIKKVNGEFEIPNPVNPQENFADKWRETPRKRENFFNWLKEAQRDFGLYLNQSHDQLPNILQERIGEMPVKAVLSRIGASAAISVGAAVAAEVAAVQRLDQATKPWVK